MGSSSSTSSSERRPLGTAWLLVVLALTAAALELWVVRTARPPTHLLDKVRAYHAREHGTLEELILLGTCLPEEILDADSLAYVLGPHLKAQNLTAAGTAALEWHLVVANHLPADARVAAVVVPFGPRELTSMITPWETQAMDLARWEDLPLLIQAGCVTPSCAAEVILRKASRLYRHRGYLADRAWRTLGTLAPGATTNPDIPPPPNLGQLGADAPPPGIPTGPPYGPGPGEVAARQPALPEASPDLWSPRPKGAVPTTDSFQKVKVARSAFGWKAELSWLSATEAPRFFLRELMEEAQARRVPLIFVALPLWDTGATSPAQRRADEDDHAEMAALIELGGARLIDLRKAPGMKAEYFTWDGRHATREGMRVISDLIGREVMTALGREVPPPLDVTP